MIKTCKISELFLKKFINKISNKVYEIVFNRSVLKISIKDFNFKNKLNYFKEWKEIHYLKKPIFDNQMLG